MNKNILDEILVEARTSKVPTLQFGFAGNLSYILGSV